MSSGPVTLIERSMIRSVRLIKVAEALYQTVMMSEHARLGDLPPANQQIFHDAAIKFWEQFGDELIRSQR